MSGSKSNNQGTPMTKEDAGRIQAAQAKSGGDMSPGGFAARAQSAGDRNTNDGNASFGHKGGNGGAQGGGAKK